MVSNDQPQSRKGEETPTIQSRPRPGAYLCESTARRADYWLKNGRELPNRDEAVLAVEQSINAWKNLAYDLAEKLHFSGYLRDPEAPRSETGRIVNDRTSADLRRFFDRVAEESLGDYPWKVETALLAVYRLGREDERGERQGG